MSGIALLIALGYGGLAVWRHAHFRSSGHDLGIFDQAIWELSRLAVPATSIRVIPLPNLFGDHFHPVLLLLVPWYWLFDSAAVLGVAQAVLFAAAAPLAFVVAREFGMGPWPAAGLAVSLGIHPGFTAAVLADFHETAFAPLLLLAVVLAAERARWCWYWVALAGFLLTKESMGFYAALYGVSLILRRRWTVGMATLLVGVGYSWAVTSVVIPSLGAQRYIYWRHYEALGDSPRQVIATVLSHPVDSLALLFSSPEKRRTIHLMLASFAYLPVASWTTWPLVLLTLAERFWSGRAELWGFRHQYQVVMTTVFFVAALYALRDAGRRFPRVAASMPALCLVVLLGTAWTIAASGAWTDAFKSASPATLTRWRSGVARIPSGARVSAQGPFVPHLAHRPTIYQFPRVRDAEYVMLDPEADSWPLTPAEVRRDQERLADLGWQIAWRQDTTTVFRRTPASRALPAPPYWE